MGLIHSIAKHQPKDTHEPQIESWYIPLAGKKAAVFGVLHIENGDESGKIEEIMKRELEHSAEHAGGSEARLEPLFENLIDRLNRGLASFFNHENTIGLHEVGAAVGMASDTELVLTGIGAMRAIFVREDIPNTFHVFDLLKSLTKESLHAENFFGALVVGDMRPQDTLLITTPATIDAVGDTAMKRAVGTMEARATAQVIAHALDTHHTAGIALIIQCTSNHETAKTTTPHASVASLRATEKTTRQTLAGTPRMAIASWCAKLASAVRTLLLRFFQSIKNRQKKKDGFRPEKEKQLSPPPEGRGRERGGGANTIVRFARGIILFFVNLFSTAAHLVRHPKKINEVRQALGRIVNLLIDRFNALPKTTKLLSLGILVFVVLFTQSILYLNFRHAIRARNEAYAAAASRITELKDAAAASLIYQDERVARDKLLEARRRAEELPRDSRSRRIKAETIEKEIDAALMALRHEITVTPEIVATLPASPDPKAFDRWLYRLGNPNETEELKTAHTYENRTVGQLGSGDVVLAGESGERSAINVSFPQGPVADTKLFGSKLYLLVPGASQIYRLNRRGESFSGLTPWLSTEDPDLKDAHSIAIDGAIYALRPNGIIKYFTGVREEWNPYIDPPLVTASRIATDDETQGIYILDGQRIIVLSKQSNLVAQYVFPTEPAIRDFVVNEQGKQLSVLAGDKIEHIPLTHLK